MLPLKMFCQTSANEKKNNENACSTVTGNLMLKKVLKLPSFCPLLTLSRTGEHAQMLRAAADL
jgi:hypothetical protein